MALVTRRYNLVGPTAGNLVRYVDPTAVPSATYPTPTIDITIDNTVADIITTLDEYMALQGYEFGPSVPVVPAIGSNVLTFRPGSGLSGPNVFDNFDALYLVFDFLRTSAQLSGKFKIIFDDAFGSPVLLVPTTPGPITWDFLYAELIGVHEDANVDLSIKETGSELDSLTIINALWWEGLNVTCDAGVHHNAQPGQTFTLTRTTFSGAGGNYCLNFIGAAGCVVHLNDESQLLRSGVFPAGLAAIRILTDLTVHVNGANTKVNANAFTQGAPSTVFAFINSSSARFDFDQADVSVLNATMSTAAGYWTAGPPFTATDPNGLLTATKGTLISDESTGLIWRNTDGATAWSIADTSTPVEVAVIFDDAVPADKVNIRSDRASNQSAIDNTKTQITNLGSQDGLWNGAAVGATAQAATIGGGDDNEATNDYATVAGGAGNSATGYAAAVSGGYLNQATAEGACVPGGEENLASGEGSCAFGVINTATDFYAFAQGVFSNATNSNAMAMGQSCDATGDSAAAIGAALLSSGTASFACCSNNDSTGDFSFTAGNGCTAQGDYSQAMGSGCFADGFYSHAQGASTQTTDDFAHAQNFNTVAGFGGHAEGDSCSTTGDFAHAEGRLSVGTGNRSHAQGIQAVALRESQDAVAGGAFAVAGDAQTSMLVLRGTTPGLAPGESVELLFGAAFDQQLVLENGKSYDFRVRASVGGVQGGPVRRSRSIEISFNVRRDAGLSVITAIGPGSAYGDASTATWILTPTIGVAPDRVVLTFATGAGVASACKVSARVEFTEVQY
jgi:hypothetical protein